MPSCAYVLTCVYMHTTAFPFCFCTRQLLWWRSLLSDLLSNKAFPRDFRSSEFCWRGGFPVKCRTALGRTPIPPNSYRPPRVLMCVCSARPAEQALFLEPRASRLTPRARTARPPPGPAAWPQDAGRDGAAARDLALALGRRTGRAAAALSRGPTPATPVLENARGSGTPGSSLSTGACRSAHDFGGAPCLRELTP